MTCGHDSGTPSGGCGFAGEAGAVTPHEFFCRLAERCNACTVRKRAGGVWTVICVEGGVAGWIGVRSGRDEGEFCLAVEGGERWAKVRKWRDISLGDFGPRGVALCSGGEAVFFKGMPWVIGTDIPDQFHDSGGVARWIFDSEGGGVKLGHGVSGAGVTFGGGEAVFKGGSCEIRGGIVSSPFDAEIALDSWGAEILVSLVNGGGRFAVDLHRGKLGPLVVRGGRGGVAVAVTGG